MLNTIPVAIIAGILLGYLAGLGIGGGSLLILYLTAVIGMDSDGARAINLMFFITAAGSVFLIRRKRGELNLRRILPAIAGGCVTSALFSILRYYLDEQVLRKLFGILLLATGIRELFYRPRKAR